MENNKILFEGGDICVKNNSFYHLMCFDHFTLFTFLKQYVIIAAHVLSAFHVLGTARYYNYIGRHSNRG